MTELVVVGSCVAFGFMTTVWAASVWRRNAAFVDRAWGGLFALLAGTYLVVADDVGWRGAVVAALVATWGARLTVHIIVSGWRDGEGWRHREVRARHGQRFAIVSLVSLFWPQAVAAVAVSTPLLAAIRHPGAGDVRALDVVGIGVFAVGLAVEAIADAQLLRFRRAACDGRIFDGGLWRYSRHPNYFGDAMVWWGLGLVGVSGAWWAMAGPLGMTLFLVFGTGVRAMDRHLLATRGEAYAERMATTHAFVPMPRRRLRAPSVLSTP